MTLFTALHLAALDCWIGVEAIKLLLVFGADKTMRDSDGLTPQDLALKEARILEAETLDGFDITGEEAQRLRTDAQQRFSVQVVRISHPPQPELAFPFLQNVSRITQETRWYCTLRSLVWQVRERLPFHLPELSGHEHSIMPLAEEVCYHRIRFVLA
jgi:hypothetical protein